MLKAKTGYDHLTFAQLHELIEKRPELGLKDLYLTGTDVDQDQTVVFSHENEETKDVDIIDALRATMSFPFAFRAHEIEIKGQRRKFIDGGVKNNYPMNIFPNIEEVLGFKVDNRDECEKLLFREDIPNKETRIGNFIALSQDGDVYHRYRYNTVQIYDADVWTLNFALDELTKFILKQSGEESMKAFIKAGYQSEPVHTNELINVLMNLGSDLNDAAYAEAQHALMLLQSKYADVAKQVAPIVIRILHNYRIAGFKPGADAAYNE